MELVLASHNLQKLLELRSIFKALCPQIEVLSLCDFPQYKRPVIHGDSFEENAARKALLAAKSLQKICLGDDSGIVVPALGKIGQTLKRRYQNEADSPVVQTKKLLQEMAPFKEQEREAYLECAIAIATPQEVKRVVTARSEGTLAVAEKGKVMLEFDTIFIKHDYSKTIGELPQHIRDRISHRRKAVEKLLPLLESMILSAVAAK